MKRLLLIPILCCLAAGSCEDGGTTPAAGPGATSAATSAPATSAPATSAPATSAPPSAPAAGEAQTYVCTDPISDAELVAATGISDAAMVTLGEDTTDVEGQTYCQVLSSGVAISISVWTGPSYDAVFTPLVQGDPSAERISGIGDEAGWSNVDTTFAARVGSTGLTVAWADMGSTVPGNAKDASVEIAKLVLTRI